MNGERDRIHLFRCQSGLECCIDSLQDFADRRLLVAQLRKDDPNDSIVLVPPYHVRLPGAALERLNNIFGEAAPPSLPVPQAYPEFEEQQEKGALRAVRPLSLELQNPGERFYVKNCFVPCRDHDQPLIASTVMFFCVVGKDATLCAVHWEVGHSSGMCV